MSNISIDYPVTEGDLTGAAALVEECLCREEGCAEDLKKASLGEVLVVKKSDELVGMLSMRRPGKIFDEIEDKYFNLELIKFSKEEIGYIALVVIKKEVQGQGIGKTLVQKAIELQKEWGAKAIIVHASQSSPGKGSEKLFASQGFKPVFLHKAPWHDYSKEQGSEGFWCNFCGNPCNCDELEMVKEL